MSPHTPLGGGLRPPGLPKRPPNCHCSVSFHSRVSRSQVQATR